MKLFPKNLVLMFDVNNFTGLSLSVSTGLAQSLNPSLASEIL